MFYVAIILYLLGAWLMYVLLEGETTAESFERWFGILLWPIVATFWIVMIIMGFVIGGRN